MQYEGTKAWGEEASRDALTALGRRVGSSEEEVPEKPEPSYKCQVREASSLSTEIQERAASAQLTRLP